MLAPGSPMQTVPHHQTNGSTGSPTNQLLEVPQADLLRQRSAPPTPGTEQIKTKKVKGKSHFNMFRLHRHKSKSKKNPKAHDDSMLLAQSAGSALFRQKMHRVPPGRNSFSGSDVAPNRSASPIGSTSSFPAYLESEGESEDEFLKTLTNPTRRSPSPLLLRTPTPSYHQQNGSVDSDGGHNGGGDNVSITASQLESSNLVSDAYLTPVFGHNRRSSLTSKPNLDLT